MFLPADSHQVLWAALLQVVQLPVHVCQVLVDVVQLGLQVFVLLVVAVKIALVVVALLFVCDSRIFPKLWKTTEEMDGALSSPATSVGAAEVTALMCFPPVKVVIVQLVAG